MALASKCRGSCAGEEARKDEGDVKSRECGPGEVRWHVPVEVVEKAEEVEAELDEALFLVIWESAEYFCCVVHVVASTNPGRVKFISVDATGDKSGKDGRQAKGRGRG